MNAQGSGLLLSFFDCRWLARPRLWMSIHRRLLFVHWVLVWGSLWYSQSKLTWGAQVKFFTLGWEGRVQGLLPIDGWHMHLVVLMHLRDLFWIFKSPAGNWCVTTCITVSRSCLEHDASIKSSHWPPVALGKLCSRCGPLTLKGSSTQSFQVPYTWHLPWLFDLIYFHCPHDCVPNCCEPALKQEQLDNVQVERETQETKRLKWSSYTKILWFLWEEVLGRSIT